MAERQQKGVHAKDAREAADRGRKLGLGGDITVTPSGYPSKSKSDTIKDWTVEGDVKDDE